MIKIFINYQRKDQNINIMFCLCGFAILKFKGKIIIYLLLILGRKEVKSHEKEGFT